MEKLFSDLKQTVNSAVKKSGDLVELTKLKLAASDTKSAIQLNFTKLGEIAYFAAKGEDEPASEAEALVEAIDELKLTLAQQEKKIAELSNKKICPNCGKASHDDAAFCPACGNPFGKPDEA